MSDAFISYSRKDKAFVQGLHDALSAQKRKVWVDWEDIPPAAEFPKEILANIEEAQNFIFILSPDSIASTWCGRELAHAVDVHKRLFPLQCKDVDNEAVPSALRFLNWIDFRASDDFNSTLDKLTHALDTDLDYVRAHTRLLVRAREWDNRAHDKSYLLRGADLLEMEQWLSQAAAGKQPPVTQLQSDYIQNSQEAQREELQRFQDLYLKALSRQLAAQAELVKNQQSNLLQRSVLLAAESLARQPSLEADQTIRYGLRLMPRALKRMHHDGGVDAMAHSPNGHYLATAGKDNTVRLWEIASGQEIARMRLKGGAGLQVSLAFSANSAYLATAGESAVPQIWQVPSGQELMTLRNAYTAVTSLAFSPDGKYLVSGGYHGTIQQWDLASGKKLRQRKHKAAIVAISFSPDGQLMVTGSRDRLARVWETSSGKEMMRLKHPASVETMAFSPRGEYFVTTDDEGIVYVWETRSFRLLYRLRPQGDAIVSALTFSQEGDFFFTSTVATQGSVVKQNGVYAWETASGGALGSMAYEGDVNAQAFSPSANLLATAHSDGSVHLWNLRTGKEIVRGSHEGIAWAISFSPDEESFASADVAGTIVIWTTTSNGEMEYLIAGSFSRVIAASPVDSHLAIAGRKTVYVTNWRTNEQLTELHLKGDVKALTFSADGKCLATASGKSAQVWQLNGKQIKRLAHVRPVTKIAFGPDGKSLATASGRTAQIWEVATGEVQLAVKHHDQINDVSFSPDGKYLATASMDETARLWNLATGKELRSIALDRSVEAVVFSRDGNILVTTDSNTAWVWDALTGHELARLVHDGILRGIVISPDSNYIATASGTDVLIGSTGSYHAAHIWNMQSGQEVSRIQHEARIHALAFSADGKHLITSSGEEPSALAASWALAEVLNAQREHRRPNVPSSVVAQIGAAPEGRICFWLWQPEDLIARACTRLTRNFTLDEWHYYLGDEPYRKLCPSLD